MKHSEMSKQLSKLMQRLLKHESMEIDLLNEKSYLDERHSLIIQIWFLAEDMHVLFHKENG